MGASFIFFMLLLLAAAALWRDSYIVNILYLFAGAFLLGRLWRDRSMRSLVVERKFTHHAFPGEIIPVSLSIHNQGWLPLLWLTVRDQLPPGIGNSLTFQQVLTLAGKARVDYSYPLHPFKRGYYPVGPLLLASGDILGMSADSTLQTAADYLIVFPTVIPLTYVPLPSNSPLGTLRHKQPIFEDPTRPIGKREYQSGDSLRRIDWKSTASSGQLQVKQFEPSIALETMIFLDLYNESYYLRGRYNSTELAITTAASLASYIIRKKQTVGLWTNGMDPLGYEKQAQALPSRKGQPHLVRLLETLARIATSPENEFLPRFTRQRVGLSWGTTLVIISGQANEAAFRQFYLAQQAGLNLVLMLCGDQPNLDEVKQRSRHLHIPLALLHDEKDLDIWRGRHER